MGLWFGQNLVASHAKLIHIPIGLNNYRWPMGDVQVLTDSALEAPTWELRTTRLYLNVDVGTNAGRADVLAQLAQIPGAHRVSKRVDWQVYLTQLANSRYVAAPPGNGIDTHRAWEVCVNVNSPMTGRCPGTEHAPAKPVFCGACRLLFLGLSLFCCEAHSTPCLRACRCLLLMTTVMSQMHSCSSTPSHSTLSIQAPAKRGQCIGATNLCIIKQSCGHATAHD